jgi:SAM-dependent methyltransferase
MIDPRWHESFFQGLPLELWEKVTTPERTRAESDFLERALALSPGARLLDLPCGNGRHARELAARGHQVVGVDGSAEQLQMARRLTVDGTLAVEWRLGDMREPQGESAFDGAWCLGNSFGYFDREGTRRHLQAVGAALKPGARFVIETGFAAECLLPNLHDRQWMPVGDMLFLEENRYHVREGCLETVYTFVKGEQTVERTGWQWVFTVREIGELLQSAGLAVEELLGSLAGEPYEPGAPHLLVVARKE